MIGGRCLSGRAGGRFLRWCGHFPSLQHQAGAIETKPRLESLTKRQESAIGMRRRPYNIDLRAHLEQCDDNYRRLTRLMPDLSQTDRREFRMFPHGAALIVSFEVTHRSRYTTVLTLDLPASGRSIGGMRIKIRVYHDARTAEVIEFQGQRRFPGGLRLPQPRDAPTRRKGPGQSLSLGVPERLPATRRRAPRAGHDRFLAGSHDGRQG